MWTAKGGGGVPEKTMSVHKGREGVLEAGPRGQNLLTNYSTKCGTVN